MTKNEIINQFPLITFMDFEENNSEEHYNTYAITPFDKWFTYEEMEIVFDPIEKEMHNGVYGKEPASFICFYNQLYENHLIYAVLMVDYINKDVDNRFELIKITNQDEFKNLYLDSLKGIALMRLIIPELDLLLESMFDLTDLLHFRNNTSLKNIKKVQNYFENCGLNSLEWGQNKNVLK